MEIERMYSTEEIAEMVGLKPSYLAKRRQHHDGPEYTRIGKLVRYRVPDVKKWLASQQLVKG